jgi:hypothetical protein
VAAALLSLAILAGCGGGGAASTAAAPTGASATVQVQLTPAVSSVASGSALALTASVAGSTNPALTWSVNGIAQGNASVGTIAGTGTNVTYTAPAAAGTYNVTATSVADSAASATTLVTVPIQVSLLPGASTLASSGSLAFTASVSSSTNPAVTWTVDGVANGNFTVGTITGTGDAVTYTAPAAAGSHTVTATSAADPTKSASSVVTVQASASAVAVSVAPAALSLNTGASSSITASVTGSSSTAVAWTVDGVANGNATVGTLTGSGNTVSYTAPAAAGSHTVTATSSANSAKSASTSVSVLAPAVVVTDNPASATLAPGGALAITASVSGSSNTAVTWTVDGVANGNSSVGTLAGTGNTVTYTAPAAAGSHTVTATSSANTASGASTAITVQASTGTAVVALANSGPASVNTTGSVLFTATVTGTSNTAVTWSVDSVANGNATVGTITAGSGGEALYLAPAATGSHTITATSSADATKSASTVLAVNSNAYTVTGKVYNAKTGYGATGNGSSNDTAAIQDAINAAASAGGGVVEVPAGTYMIAAADSGGLQLASNVFLQIDSGATLKLLSAPGTANMIMISGANNCGIIGSGTIDGNRSVIGTNESIELVTAWGTTGAVIAGVTIQNSPGDGIYLNGYPSAYGTPVSNVLIYGATITNNGRNGMSPDGCDGLIVRDCTFSNQVTANPMNGIDCEPINNQAPGNYLIFHNSFTGNSGGGIQSGADDSGDNATFTNMTYAFNTVSNNGNYGLEAQDGKGPVLIMNNKVSGTTASYEFGGYGIMTRGSNGISNVTIMGNTVTTSQSDGIYLGSATASVCADNTVTGSGGEGIDNQSGSGVTVSSNTESGNSGGN